MPARNGEDRFGWVTRALHWGMALGIVAMLGFGTLLEEMEPSLSNLWLYGLHKSVGLLLLALVVARLAWHRLSPPPAPPEMPPWQRRAAEGVRLAFYALMIAVPLTGWIASSATGIDTVFFGQFTIPSIAPLSEDWEEAFFDAHGALTKLLILLVLFHAAAALHHALILKDGTLRRMVSGRP